MYPFAFYTEACPLCGLEKDEPYHAIPLNILSAKMSELDRKLIQNDHEQIHEDELLKEKSLIETKINDKVEYWDRKFNNIYKKLSDR